MLNSTFLEDIAGVESTDLTISSLSTYDDILMMRSKMEKELERSDEKKEKEEPKAIIGNILVIDDQLLSDMEFEPMKTFRQLLNVKGDVDIYVDINMPISFVAYMFGCLPCIPKLLSGKTTLHINGASNITALLIGSVVDEVKFGSMASISLANLYPTNGYDDDRLTFILDKVLSFWVNKGLLTQEEVDSLKESKTKASVYISSDRINKGSSK